MMGDTREKASTSSWSHDSIKRKPMHTIVTQIASSDVTSKVMEQTQVFAKALNSRVILIHVMPAQSFVMEEGVVSSNIPERTGQEAKMTDYAGLTAQADILSEAGVNVLSEQLLDGDINMTLLAKCKESKADLIIIGANNHSTLCNWFVGSFRDQLIKAARSPLLVVPATREVEGNSATINVS